MTRRALLSLGAGLAALAAATGEAAVQPAAPLPGLLFPEDAEFRFETQRLFGAGDYGGALFGEVVAMARAITSGDYESWYAVQNAFADRIAAEAEAQRAKGHAVSARDGFLRASNYYRSSEFFLHGNPADPRIRRAYDRAVACYKAAAALFAPAIEPVEIPYENTTLPAYVHVPPGPVERRKTLLLNTGFDGSAEEMHFSGARAAVERGYTVIVFDGPGQSGPLHRQGLTFRPDWEKVVTPVLDFALARADVDPRRIALHGASFGGYLAPRAAAFEHRLAACIADDGVYDYGASQIAGVPADQRAAFLRGLAAPSAPALNAALAEMMRHNSVARWALAHGPWAFGVRTPREYLAAAQGYHLRDGIAEQIRCPTLVCDAEDDLFFRGQPQALFDHLTCPKTLLRFTREEGAGAHCEVGASRLAYARIYDWLDETLG